MAIIIPNFGAMPPSPSMPCWPLAVAAWLLLNPGVALLLCLVVAVGVGVLTSRR